MAESGSEVMDIPPAAPSSSSNIIVDTSNEPPSAIVVSATIEPPPKNEEFIEPEKKRRKLDPKFENVDKLENRLGGILCCAVCLDLPKAAVYQVFYPSLFSFFILICY